MKFPFSLIGVTLLVPQLNPFGDVNMLVFGMSTTNNYGQPQQQPKVVVSVCTGPDCRVDGASGSLRALQKSLLSGDEHNKQDVKVRAVPCLGPCGDGPCVLVLQNQQENPQPNSSSNDSNRLVRVVEPQHNRGPGSLAPADMFGANPRGVYQVRTREHVQFVTDLVRRTIAPAGVSTSTTTTTTATPSSALTAPDDESKEFVADETRPWYDRPRNERKALQRLGQVLVVVGLANYSDAHSGEIGRLQWTIGIVLLVASNLIMKENLLDTLIQKVVAKTKQNRNR